MLQSNGQTSAGRVSVFIALDTTYYELAQEHC